MAYKDSKALKITAYLASPIIGAPPMLDGILELEMVQREGKANKIHKRDPAPPYGEIHIPMLRRDIGGLLVPCCSSPIYVADQETVEHFAKRLGVEYSNLVSPDRRKVVATGNQVFKSYRLPLHTVRCSKVVWFCRGNRRPIKSLLRSVKSLGRKRSYGYGRVSNWELEWVDNDWSWFVETDQGELLMRPLPACKETEDVIGGFPDFGPCQSPYWHPDRFVERVVPC